METGQVALVHPGNFFAEGFFVAHLRQGKEPVLGAVPQHDAHFILRPERVQHAERAIAGDLISVHELHPVHHHRHGAAGQDLFAVQFHIHRQRRLQGRAPIRSGRVGLVAPDADQPHAKIPHRALHQFHRLLAQVPGRQIADEDGVVALHLGQRARDPVQPGRPGLQPRGLQRANQRFVLVRLRRHHQHARVAADIDETAGPIVLRHVVPGRFDIDGVAIEAGFGERLREGKQVFARGELHLLLAQRLFIAIEAHGRSLRPVGLDEDFGLEGLSFLDAVGQSEFLHRHIVAALHSQRHDVQGHPQRARRQQRRQAVADVLVPVRKQHQSLLAGFRKRRRPEADRPGDVRSLRPHDRQDLRVVQVDFVVRRSLERGFGAKNQQPNAVAFLLVRRGLVDIAAGRFLLRRRNAVGPIEQKENVHSLQRSPPLQTSQRQAQRQQHYRPQTGGQPPPPLADLDIARPSQPEHPGQRRRQDEQVIRMRELEVHEARGVSIARGARRAEPEIGRPALPDRRTNFCTR